MRKVIFFTGLILFLLFPDHSFAASISSSIINPNSTYQIGDEVVFSTTLDINATDGTQYYLRGVFYKAGTSNYCGYTWNGSAFYNSPVGDGKNFLKILVSGNKWSGEFKAKIDSEDPDCKESGGYKFKVQRYTESGSSSFDDQSELEVNFNIPAPTNTPTPTSTNTPTPTPTNTPTPTPTPVPNSSNTSTPTPTKKVTPTPIVNPTGIDEEATVEATMMSAMAEQQPQQEVQGAGIDLGGGLDELDKKETQYNWAKLLILMGAVLVTCACGILVYNNYLKDKLEEMRTQ